MKTILIDCDGVLADFSSAFQRYVQYATGKPQSELTKPQTWNFWPQWGLTEAEFWKLFEGFEAKNGYLRCPAIRGARDGVKQLAASGVHISIATARGCNTNLSGFSQSTAVIDTATWLRDNLALNYNALHFTSDKSGLPGDILVDDAVHHLEAWRATGRRAVCFSQPWNKDWDGERVGDWRELVQLIIQN